MLQGEDSFGALADERLQMNTVHETLKAIKYKPAQIHKQDEWDDMTTHELPSRQGDAVHDSQSSSAVSSSLSSTKSNSSRSRWSSLAAVPVIVVAPSTSMKDDSVDIEMALSPSSSSTDAVHLCSLGVSISDDDVIVDAEAGAISGIMTADELSDESLDLGSTVKLIAYELPVLALGG